MAGRHVDRRRQPSLEGSVNAAREAAVKVPGDSCRGCGREVVGEFPGRRGIQRGGEGRWE